MAFTAFGPQGPNYTTTRPPRDPKASLGVDTFFKNCSAPGAKDGTFATADYFNVHLANLRYLVRQSGVELDDQDDTMVFDAVMALITQQIGTRPVLLAPRTYYVSTFGNDALDGLTVGAPFRTIQHACNVAAGFNLNGYLVTIVIATGVYNENVELGIINGNGQIMLLGDAVTPGNVTIMPTAGPAFIWGGVGATYGWHLRGLKISAPADGVREGCGLRGGSGSNFLSNCEFGACLRSQIHIDGGELTIWGSGVGGTFLKVSGNAERHTRVLGGGRIRNYAPDLTLVGSIAFSDACIVSEQDSQYLGRYGSVTGSATGVRYITRSNGLIDTNGAGASHFPGSAPGTTATQGLYI